MNETEWLEFGIDSGFVWSFCLNHDNHFNDSENAARDNGDTDFCAYAFRLISEKTNGGQE